MRPKYETEIQAIVKFKINGRHEKALNENTVRKYLRARILRFENLDQYVIKLDKRKSNPLEIKRRIMANFIRRKILGKAAIKYVVEYLDNGDGIREHRFQAVYTSGTHTGGVYSRKKKGISYLGYGLPEIFVSFYSPKIKNGQLCGNMKASAYSHDRYHTSRLVDISKYNEMRTFISKWRRI